MNHKKKKITTDHFHGVKMDLSLLIHVNYFMKIMTRIMMVNIHCVVTNICCNTACKLFCVSSPFDVFTLELITPQMTGEFFVHNAYRQRARICLVHHHSQHALLCIS